MSDAGGSEQQRTYRRLRREGSTMTTACVLAGISMGEARLLEAEDARNPPPAEALEPISPAAGQPQPAKENVMSRASAKRAAEEASEVIKPDFARAVRLYRNDIKPAMSKQSEHGQEQSTAYKEIKNQCHVQPGAAKQAFALDRMEESKRDDWLRSFRGVLKELKIFMPKDMVDDAEGNDDAGGEVVPVGERQRPKLATVPVSDGVDVDLAGEDDDEQLPQAAE